jgi:uncharacterized membrane protein YcaP (DUF421 family)
MFSPDLNLLEVVARTLLVYLALLVALRLAGKRELGQMTPFDLIVLLLISEAVQNAIIGGDESLTGGLIAAGVLIGTNYSLAFASERVSWRLRQALEGVPTIVVSNGRFLRQNMKKEGLGEEEILMAIRQQGIGEVKDVHLAVLETDGTISVVPAGGKPHTSKRSRLFRKQ